eukprot:1194959-Prorocentrum_minimum.AAC.12
MGNAADHQSEGLFRTRSTQQTGVSSPRGPVHPAAASSNVPTFGIGGIDRLDSEPSSSKPRPFSARDAKITRKAPIPSFRKASPSSADDGIHRPRKKAAEAAQQLWYEWSAENLENMSKAAQRRRLGPDAQKAIINEADTSRLVKLRQRQNPGFRLAQVLIDRGFCTHGPWTQALLSRALSVACAPPLANQQAEKMKEMADARLAQCAEFWQECPKASEKSKTKVIENARKVARNAVTHQLLEEILQAE